MGVCGARWQKEAKSRKRRRPFSGSLRKKPVARGDCENPDPCDVGMHGQNLTRIRQVGPAAPALAVKLKRAPKCSAIKTSNTLMQF